MAGWHHQCNGRELHTSGDGEGQGGPACCSPQGCEESDATGPLNNNNKETKLLEQAFGGLEISVLPSLQRELVYRGMKYLASSSI